MILLDPPTLTALGSLLFGVAAVIWAARRRR
jgi:hypothetical protein